MNNQLQINPYTLMANIGLEKESLRVTQDGRLARTPHPFPEDSHLDVDFSENQMEFITGIRDSPDKVYEELLFLHKKAIQSLSQRDSGAEYLWPFSNPPYIESDQENPPMEFAGANRWKTEYRKHLQQRYGTRLMLYSGIHFNFSFQEEFFQAAGFRTQEQRNQAYLNLAAWSTRYAWLVVYLLAASPVLDPSFFAPEDPRQKQIRDYASPRCSWMGYWNTFDPVLDYSNLDAYVASINRYVENGTLMYPAELYYPVRLKPAGAYNMETLREEGINHIEIRVIDENPYSPVGITREDIQFLHLLMVYLMHRDPKEFTEDEQVTALHRMKDSAYYDDSRPFSRGNGAGAGGFGKTIRDAAKDSLHRMEGFFRRGPFSQLEQQYIRETMDYQWKKFQPNGRRAAQVRSDFQDCYMEAGLELAKKYARI